MSDDLMMRIEMRRGGKAVGAVGFSMAPTVDVARILLRLAFPTLSRVEWSRGDEGWTFSALMPASWLAPTVDDARRALDAGGVSKVDQEASDAPTGKRVRRKGRR